MTTWRTKSEEASVVFVGHFNPKIFHPEWLVRKEIYNEWDYGGDESFLNMFDLSRFNLPGNQQIEVLLNRFLMRAQRRSDFVVFRDKVVEIFNCLPETPVTQVGMNYARVVSTNNVDSWEKAGTKFAKKSPWKKMVSYFNDLEPKKQAELGLVSMTYQFPRPDDLPGYIRAKMEITGSPSARTLKIDINNHSEIAEKQYSAQLACNILADHWEKSIEIADQIVDGILN